MKMIMLEIGEKIVYDDFVFVIGIGGLFFVKIFLDINKDKVI